MKNSFFYILLSVFALCLQEAIAQTEPPKTKRIEIIYGGEFTIDNVKYPGATIFKTDGQRVQFRHQGLSVLEIFSASFFHAKFEPSRREL